MSISAPAVTVIISTYNWSTVLPYSIGSVLRQTRTDFEVLVVGDGCTDDSADVVNAVGDSRVRWINLPEHTRHQSGPNNEGLRQAQGELIAYLGHDDLWLPHHLSCLTTALADGADLAYGIARMVDPDGNHPEPIGPLQSYRPGDWIPPTSVLHRRSVIDRVGHWRDYRDLDVDPEVDLWRRAYERGHRFAFVPRLTAVKFPAVWRRDVYKERPNHEQAAWSQRMQSQADMEAVELAKMLAAAARYQQPYRELLRDFVGETVRRVRSLLARKSDQPGHIGKGQIMEARRALKGLEQSL